MSTSSPARWVPGVAAEKGREERSRAGSTIVPRSRARIEDVVCGRGCAESGTSGHRRRARLLTARTQSGRSDATQAWETVGLREVDIQAASMVDLRAARAGHLLWRKPPSAKFANLSIASVSAERRRTNSIGAFLKAGLFMIELYRAIMEGNRRRPLVRDRSSFRERLRSNAYSIRLVEAIEWLGSMGAIGISDRDEGTTKDTTVAQESRGPRQTFVICLGRLV
jgi:hypothetical protein